MKSVEQWDKQTPVDLSFTCKHQVIPEPSAETDLLFKYARWLQKNNAINEDESVYQQVERLYRIAAENGHFKAMMNLLNGGIRGEFRVTEEEKLRFAQTMIDNDIAAGYRYVSLFLNDGSTPLKPDALLASRFYRKAADEGNPEAQEHLGDILGYATGAPEVANVMLRCAAEQGMGEAALMLGLDLKYDKNYLEAIEAFQLGVMAGNDSSALRLNFAYGLMEDEKFTVYGQKEDKERARRYEIIGDLLSEYSYYNPKVPELNDIVPLPPAELPPWDGKLQWVEAHLANEAPPKPSEALIVKLAKNKQLNPQTGRPLPESPNFEGN